MQLPCCHGIPSQVKRQFHQLALPSTLNPLKANVVEALQILKTQICQDLIFWKTTGEETEDGVPQLLDEGDLGMGSDNKFRKYVTNAAVYPNSTML